jgi:hypothetical protein
VDMIVMGTAIYRSRPPKKKKAASTSRRWRLRLNPLLYRYGAQTESCTTVLALASKVPVVLVE